MIRTLADVCKLSYEDVPVLSGYTCCVTKRQNLVVCYFYNKANIIIAFRGTDDIEDWKMNIDITRDDDDIHTGFHEAWRSIEEDVLQKLSYLTRVQRRLFITGHSLGGALAILAGYYITDRHPIHSLVVFECPRVGGSTFKDRYNTILYDKTICYVNNNDIVPRLPVNFGYRNIGQLRYWDIFGRCHQEIPIWKKFLDRLTGRLTNPLFDGIKDHNMDVVMKLHHKKVHREKFKGEDVCI